MQRCVAEDNLDMVSTSVHVLALLGGGACPVAGRHSFLYEGRIPLWWRSHSRYWSGGHTPPPRFQCAVLPLEGDPVRVAIYNAALTGSRVLILADVWSGLIACRRVLCVINIISHDQRNTLIVQ